MLYSVIPAVPCQPCRVEVVSISTFSAFIHKILYSTQQPSAGSLEFAVVLTRHVSDVYNGEYTTQISLNIVHSLCRMRLFALLHGLLNKLSLESIVLYCTILSKHHQTSRTCLVLSLLFGKFSAIRAALLPHSGLSLEPPVKCVYTFAVFTLHNSITFKYQDGKLGNSHFL
jgi:hypothetical protein